MYCVPYNQGFSHKNKIFILYKSKHLHPCLTRPGGSEVRKTDVLCNHKHTANRELSITLSPIVSLQLMVFNIFSDTLIAEPFSCQERHRIIKVEHQLSTQGWKSGESHQGKLRWDEDTTRQRASERWSKANLRCRNKSRSLVLNHRFSNFGEILQPDCSFGRLSAGSFNSHLQIPVYLIYL